MKPLSERDENFHVAVLLLKCSFIVGMKPLSERDENPASSRPFLNCSNIVGMKPLSERDENQWLKSSHLRTDTCCRNEATL